MRSDRTGDALVEMIDALTTNHTSFFREPAHFDFLVGRVFAEQKRSRSHADLERCLLHRRGAVHHCAHGAGAPGSAESHPARILATDISTRVLETARKGIYKAERFQGSAAPWLRKHLLRGEGRWKGWYRMRPEILGMVEFRRVNLIEPLPEVGRFTVIFCRNVMIYFSRETQEQLVNRLAACLEPGGYLFVGHSESLTGLQNGLQHIQPAIYRKRGGEK